MMKTKNNKWEIILIMSILFLFGYIIVICKRSLLHNAIVISRGDKTIPHLIKLIESNLGRECWKTTGNITNKWFISILCYRLKLFPIVYHMFLIKEKLSSSKNILHKQEIIVLCKKMTQQSLNNTKMAHIFWD